MDPRAAVPRSCTPRSDARARRAGAVHDRLEVEVLGIEAAAGRTTADEFVAPARIRELNRAHRRRDAVTDVLSFPVDAAGAAAGPRELGDVVVCPARTGDLREAVVHGALHLAGLDHETDAGEMLALQDQVMAGLR